MAGDVRIRSPQGVDFQENTFQEVVETLATDSQTPVEALRKLPWQALVTSHLNMRCFPTLSGGFTGWAEHPQQLQKQIVRVLDRLKTLVIGDCMADVSIVLKLNIALGCSLARTGHCLLCESHCSGYARKIPTKLFEVFHRG